MKILFICDKDVSKKSHGGFQCTNRNYLSFCEIVGDQNVEVFNFMSGHKKSFHRRVIKWINYFKGFREGLSYQKIKQIISLSNGFDYIFIDSSQFGIIARYLRKAKYPGKIICFFHNVEYNIGRQYVKIKPKSFYAIFLSYYNEKNAIRFSDKIVVLNYRDLNELIRVYEAKSASIIPISFIDTYKNNQKGYTSTPPTFLFFGNVWFPNIHGLTWFVNNVLDHVNIKLQIVGIGMDALRDRFVHPKIEFLGYVPDLSEVLFKADYIISPTFIGGGMKVKICESLMYGKNIIGTPEAFEGYELDYDKVGAICSTKDEFISTIKTLSLEKREIFNEYSRKSFLEKYSFQSTLTAFKELLSN